MPLPAAPPTAHRPPAGGSGMRRVGWRPATAVGATIVTVAPALLVLARFAFREVLLTGDIAIIDARVRDLADGALALVGPYSVGWSHPGPMVFYLLAPLSALTGGAPWALIVGGALLHVLAVGLSARLAWRRGGLALTLGILAVYSLSLLGATDRILLDPWNPHVAMPFFVLFVLQAWSATVGDRWQLLGAAIVGTFLVQTHLGYAPLVAVGMAFAVTMMVIDVRRSPEPTRAWAAPLAVSAAVMAALWSTAVYEQFTRDPGNMTLIVRWFRDPPEALIGLRGGAGTFAAQFHPVPVWLGGPQELVPLTFQPRPESLWWLLVPLALSTVAAVVAIRKRLHDEGRLVALVALSTATGIIALGRIKEHAWSYMSLWRIPLALLVVLVAFWTLWRAWDDPPPLARRLGLAACGLAILGGVVPVGRDILTTDHVAARHDCIAPLVAQARSRVPTGRLLVRGVGQEGVSQAIIDDLDRRGVDVVVDPDAGALWGSSRAASVADVDEVWIVAEEGVLGARLASAPGAHIVAVSTPLPGPREAELARLQLEVAERLDRAGRSDLVPWLDYRDLALLIPDQVPGIDRVEIDRIAELLEQSSLTGTCRALVVSFEPDELPT